MSALLISPFTMICQVRGVIRPRASGMSCLAARQSDVHRATHPHSDRSLHERITVMEPYKGYFIRGSALLIHPFSPDWYVGGSILVPGRSSSVIEVTRFQLQRFTVSIKELAEWFGLEVAQIVVDECLPQREN